MRSLFVNKFLTRRLKFNLQATLSIKVVHFHIPIIICSLFSWTVSTFCWRFRSFNLCCFGTMALSDMSFVLVVDSNSTMLLNSPRWVNHSFPVVWCGNYMTINRPVGIIVEPVVPFCELQLVSWWSVFIKVRHFVVQDAILPLARSIFLSILYLPFTRVLLLLSSGLKHHVKRSNHLCTWFLEKYGESQQ